MLGASVELKKVDDRHASRNRDQPLFETKKQVIYLGNLGFRFFLRDVPDSKGAAFALIHELAIPAIILLIERGHDLLP